MNSPHQLATAALFFGAGSFFAGVYGHASLCIVATFATGVLVLLALFAWNEKKRYAEMRNEAGSSSQKDFIKRANGVQQGCEWDAKGGPDA